MNVNDFTTTLGVKLKPGTKQEVKGLEDSVKNLTNGFKTLAAGIGSVVTVMGIMKTMDFIQGISKATNELRNLGMAMDLPLTRMDAITRGFTAAGISAAAMIDKIRSVRYTLTDSWGYATETAYRWGISAGDNKTDDQIADQIAAKAQSMKNPRTRDRFLRDMGITDPTQQRWYYDKAYRTEMKADANSGIKFTDDQLNRLAEVNKEYNKLQVHVDGISKSFSLGAAGGMTAFYKGLKNLINTPEINKLADRIGAAFAGAFKMAGRAMDELSSKIKGYQPLNNLLDAMRDGDMGKMGEAVKDMWQDFKDVIADSKIWEPMGDALKSVAMDVGFLIAEGMSKFALSVPGRLLDAGQELIEEAIGNPVPNLTPNEINNGRKYQEALMKGGAEEWAPKLQGNSSVDFSTGYLAQSTQVLNPNPLPVKQNIDSSVTFTNYFAAGSEDIEDTLTMVNAAQAKILSPFMGAN